MAGGGASAGASAWARYRALAGEYRQERIAVRLVLAGAAGVMAAGLGGTAGWWAGPAVALSAFAAHTVYVRNRPGPVTSWRQGALAERRTGRRLTRLDPGAYYVLHDRALPDAPASNLDHLVIGLTGVYAIVSRRWPPHVRLWSDHRRVWAGGRPITSLSAAAVRAARTVAELLSAELDHDVPVAPVVAVHGARVPHGGLHHGGVAYQRAVRLPRVISDHPVVFTSAQVATMAAAAERALPPMLDAASLRMDER